MASIEFNYEKLDLSEIDDSKKKKAEELCHELMGQIDFDMVFHIWFQDRDLNEINIIWESSERGGCEQYNTAELKLKYKQKINQ